MKKLIAIAAMIAAFGLGGAAAFAASSDKPSDNPGGGNDGQVCPNLDTGHQSAGDATSYTVTAPAGMVIVSVCVKAGSVQQGNGPEFPSVPSGSTSFTFSHSSGKEISHWSADFEPSDETTDTTTTDETTTDETTTDETTTDETTTDETTTTQETETNPPPRVCPDGLPPTPGEGAFDPNDDCARPPATTVETTTTTETTAAVTTVAESVAEEQPSSVFTPPVQQKVKSGKSGPAAVADPASPASATKPSKAAQPAPFTP